MQADNNQISMARKKSSRKKLNLTNLDTLTTPTVETEEQPQRTETVEELTDSPTEVSAVSVEEPTPTVTEEKAPPVEEPPQTVTEEKAPPVEEPPQTVVAVKSALLKEPPQTITTQRVAPVKESAQTVIEVRAAGEEGVSFSARSAPTKDTRLERRPQRPRPQPIQTVPEATNQEGEVFKPGDKISVKAPWGGQAIAEIASFYVDNHGGVWAQYNPLSCIPKWTWNGGCTRANLLQKGS
ncbi:MAG TPA: hypothetical protein DD379_11770 [Cyanobacteria bacterium UBA11162]|nr:hypothetical protein [Cyanobacteria bacterium UBA11162]